MHINDTDDKVEVRVFKKERLTIKKTLRVIRSMARIGHKGAASIVNELTNIHDELDRSEGKLYMPITDTNSQSNEDA